MIVKDEAALIERVLACARAFCDELVVVDTGSSDNTVALAEAMGARVIPFTWSDDFAAARNFALSQCRHDWVIWLDADDVVSEAAQEALKALKTGGLDKKLEAVFCTYHCIYSPQGQCLVSNVRERLIRRSAGLRWEGAIHETVPVKHPGRILYREDIAIEHRPLPSDIKLRTGRNIALLEHLLENPKPDPLHYFYYGYELIAQHRYEESLRAFEHYLAHTRNHPNMYTAMLAMITALEHLNRPNEAMDWCLNAIQQSKNQAEAYVRMGKLLIKQERWEEAASYFASAIGLPRPRFGIITQSDYTWAPYDYLCTCHAQLGNYETALEMAIKALPENPEPQRVIQNMQRLVEAISQKWAPPST